MSFTTDNFLAALFDDGQEPYITTLPKKEGKFFTPNPTNGSHKNNNVTAHQCFFAEWDDITLVEQSNKIKEIANDGMKPTAVVFSGNKSYHSFYRLTTPIELDEWTALQVWFLTYTGADPNVKNPARLMRLGGFGNQTIKFIGEKIETESFINWATENGYSKPSPTTAKIIFNINDEEKHKQAKAILHAHGNELVKMKKGERNAALNKFAYDMGRYIVDDAITYDEVKQKLAWAGRKCGLSDFEIDNTLTSGIKAGMDAGNPYYKVDETIDEEEVATDSDHIELVKDYLTAKNITSMQVLASTYEVNAFQMYFINQKPQKRKDLLEIVLPRIKYKQMKAMMNDVGSYNNSKPASLGAIINKENPEEIQLVIEHFIWQVKRKALGKPVEFHMMPVFVGGQGSGKTRLIEELQRTIPEYLRVETSLTQVTDERASKGLAEKLIILCDEMSQAKKADIEALKRWISSSSIDYRPMNTNRSEKVHNYSTMLGAANKDVVDMIKDESGMRRFYQINCTNTTYSPKWGRKILDWEAINNYDYEALWLSVDPHAESPAVDIMNKLTTQIVIQNSVDAWLEDGSLPENNYVVGRGYPSSILHKNYREWAFSNGYKDPWSNRKMSQYLIDNGWIKSRTKTGIHLMSTEDAALDYKAEAPVMVQ